MPLQRDEEAGIVRTWSLWPQAEPSVGSSGFREEAFDNEMRGVRRSGNALTVSIALSRLLRANVKLFKGSRRNERMAPDDFSTRSEASTVKFVCKKLGFSVLSILKNK
jgi:hypothetical protein